MIKLLYYNHAHAAGSQRGRINTLVEIIELQTVINAPAETCFRLSLSIDLELEAARSFDVAAIGGVTSGSIGLGERVTWKSKQFGITVCHTSEITRYNSPNHFRDEMVRGIFRMFAHDHYFTAQPSQTVMRDVVRFCMPFWLMGRLSEQLFAKPRLLMLLRRRNELIKKNAEGLSADNGTDQ